MRAEIEELRALIARVDACIKSTRELLDMYQISYDMSRPEARGYSIRRKTDE